MSKFLYPGCEICLVRTCCQNVCEKYRQHVEETENIIIEMGELSLEDAESAINTTKYIDMRSLKIGEKEYEFSFNYAVKGLKYKEK